jgi:hypothetical protein
MKLRIVILSIGTAAVVITWRGPGARSNIEPAAQAREEQTIAGGLTISSIAFGHQTREDDWPAIRRLSPRLPLVGLAIRGSKTAGWQKGISQQQICLTQPRQQSPVSRLTWAWTGKEAGAVSLLRAA